MSDDPRRDELARSLTAARDRVAAAEIAAARPAGSVTLLVVTKFFPAQDMLRLLDLGADEFGENREPEAGRKVAEVRAERPQAGFAVDMIGSVQRKKARTVARWARRVHSVDSPELADALAAGARRARDEGARTDRLGVLLQVSLDGDIHRGGVPEQGLDRLAGHVADLDDDLRLDGLMVIAPLDGDAEAHMAHMARIREGFVDHHPQATELSAGMSGDLEAAIAHGSTCVRVGTAIMGPRPITSP
ncbi:MAG: YggS family pyridoxal phosphate-dependent enzyme [Gordonia sp. (in: high G+C Gram-positive bacteria)]|uniref:YggS family pyridoxal phosphate-dependent enzyme n=1 Tax=Gordonia sp. (in: high G+C Gram-positive bacteria) TaxID=84139 RepID=UPI0039E37A24